ncbi:hypothetical protein ISN45_Aa03g017550 [Arabidopsis thaliana x Arabidopsis arenosa]|uniref:Transmembrane protein n=1 Tax=Arabidopsis thaliana x Arabidopsis arenosa TaxID=1240361 RepID=A0A8T2AS82_9BRAS|nr:hypothetical protein ISN45_Aa03g017550 [Arabidopsis thaliana x Arabidopsis arenosa]
MSMVHGASSVVRCTLPARSPDRNQGSSWRGEASAGCSGMSSTGCVALQSEEGGFQRLRRKVGGKAMPPSLVVFFFSLLSYLSLVCAVISRRSRSVSSTFSSQLYGGGLVMVLCCLFRSTLVFLGSPVVLFR